jgi:hypothetical protein
MQRSATPTTSGLNSSAIGRSEIQSNPTIVFEQGDIVVRWLSDTYSFDVGDLDTKQVVRFVKAINDNEHYPWIIPSDHGYQVSITNNPITHTVTLSRLHDQQPHRCEVSLSKSLVLSFFYFHLRSTNVVVGIRNTPILCERMLIIISFSNHHEINITVPASYLINLRNMAQWALQERNTGNFETTIKHEMETVKFEYQGTTRSLKVIQTVRCGTMETTYQFAINPDKYTDFLTKVLADT